MRGETLQQQEEREKRDDDIYSTIMEKPDEYADESNEENIRIGREWYSIRWILYYAQARTSGVSCMYTASMLACDMHMNEYHDVRDRRKDYLLLWQAQMHLASRRQTKKVKVAA